MNRYKFRAEVYSKVDFLEPRIGRYDPKPHRYYLYPVKSMLRKQNIKRGLRWKYRNRQIASKMRFYDLNWKFNIRRKLTHPKQYL